MTSPRSTAASSMLEARLMVLDRAKRRRLAVVSVDRMEAESSSSCANLMVSAAESSVVEV